MKLAAAPTSRLFLELAWVVQCGPFSNLRSYLYSRTLASAQIWPDARRPVASLTSPHSARLFAAMPPKALVHGASPTIRPRIMALSATGPVAPCALTMLLVAPEAHRELWQSKSSNEYDEQRVEFRRRWNEHPRPLVDNASLTTCGRPTLSTTVHDAEYWRRDRKSTRL